MEGMTELNLNELEAVSGGRNEKGWEYEKHRPLPAL